ncbi:MAG: glycosyltransferase family 2 protein [Bacteroidota bacterium]|jgi:glycosyltransferase involved in cell wall biosynthesis
MSTQNLRLSVIVPVYNEEENLPSLKERLFKMMDQMRLSGIEPEVIFVDDHSLDKTPLIIKDICEEVNSINFLRLSKNSGSHIAILAGLNYADGDYAVFLAADLQDPPELINAMLLKAKQGYHVVWALRKKIEGISLLTRLNSKIFNLLFNRFTNLNYSGADFALLDKKVYKKLVKEAGSKPSLGALIAWMGFNQTGVEYIKEARLRGKSKWTLSKKINAFIDAFVGFSYLPMRFMSIIGLITALGGFFYASIVIFLKLVFNTQIQGWTSMMVVVLILGGIQMLMIGVLGEYLWRNLEESRKRSLYHIESASELFEKKL